MISVWFQKYKLAIILSLRASFTKSQLCEESLGGNQLLHCLGQQKWWRSSLTNFYSWSGAGRLRFEPTVVAFTKVENKGSKSILSTLDKSEFIQHKEPGEQDNHWGNWSFFFFLTNGTFYNIKDSNNQELTETRIKSWWNLI